jgi:hypothetical protein
MAGVSSGPQPSQPMSMPMGQAPMQQYDAPMTGVSLQQQRTVTQTTVTTGYGGKLAPPPPEHPPI